MSKQNINNNDALRQPIPIQIMPAVAIKFKDMWQDMESQYNNVP